MSSQSPVILITGANRGIGLAILKSLAIALPRSTLLLGCRDTDKGSAAIAKLKQTEEEGLSNTAAINNPKIVPLQIDVTSNVSIVAAVERVRQQHGKLDVLINNAGFASIPPDVSTDTDGYRGAFADVLDVNVASVALCMALFLPLLRKSADARVINISSGRASMRRLTEGDMSPTVSLPYSVSKVALNALTVEMARLEGKDGVMFQCVNPGHCRTAFNGYKGLRDPMEGAIVVVECVVRGKEELGNAGFWETKGDSREVVRVPW